MRRVRARGMRLGIIGEESAEFFSAYEFFYKKRKKLTKEDIEKYLKEY